jgi:hypothetical protein
LIYGETEVQDTKRGRRYQVKISNRFATLETLHDDAEINRAWEIIREIKISAKAKEAMVR